MRGVDGNYLNTQGDALSRMQVVLQSEQARQQVQAQEAAKESLQKLREQVNEAEETEASNALKKAGDNAAPEKRDAGKNSKWKRVEGSEDEITDKTVGVVIKDHIDIRV